MSARNRRVAAILLALGVSAASGFGALVGTLWGFTLKCDDACSEDSPDWHGDVHAWQWDAMGWLSLAGFACSLSFALAVVFGRLRLAALALAAWTAVAACYLALFVGSGLTSHEARAWLVVPGLLCAGVGALALLRDGRQSGSETAV